MLFAAACLVVIFIRFLQEPQTVERIDSLFTQSAPNEPLAQSPRNPHVEPEVAILPPMPTDPSQPKQTTVSKRPKSTDVDLSEVKDNTYFRAEENVAWFETLKHLRTLSAQKLKHDSLGEITYAQFIKQPDAYRGKTITVTGTAVREESIKAPSNNIGIEQYHRLVIRPTGGGVWPLIVYSLDLPRKFPRGNKIRADVHIDGIFFKNWSYAWQDGLGLAPVILANTIEWQPHSIVPAKQPDIRWQNVVTVIAAGALLAVFVGWFAWRQSLRPTSSLGQRVIALPSEIDEVER